MEDKPRGTLEQKQKNTEYTPRVVYDGSKNFISMTKVYTLFFYNRKFCTKFGLQEMDSIEVLASDHTLYLAKPFFSEGDIGRYQIDGFGFVKKS